MSQSDINVFLGLVRGKDAAALGPSFAAINRLNMADMLQAVQQLTADERGRFHQAGFDGIPAQGCGLSKTLAEASQVGIERIKFAFRIVEESKVPQQIPGDLYETGQLRDAYNFLKAPLPTVNVWATCIGGVCEDARLRKKGDDGVIMGGDQTYGQAGWDVGIKYGSRRFNDLVGLITARCRGRFLKKFALNAHGDRGECAVNGTDERSVAIPPAMKASELDSLRPNFGAMFDFLDNVMTDDGIVFLAGCLAGKSNGGTDLLNRLSLELTPRKVVGFATVGYTGVHNQRRDGDKCVEPGVRDTSDVFEAQSEDEQYKRYFKDGQWNDLKVLPWQAETSPNAKVSQNGTIIQGKDL
jgi:hypothetical protein